MYRLLLCYLLLWFMFGCAGSLQQSHLEGSPTRASLVATNPVGSVERCQRLDTQHRNWVTIAAVAGFLGGSSGIASLAIEEGKNPSLADRNWERGLAVSTLAVGAAGVAATYEASGVATTWARECGGQ
jgi:hypothetical protein